MIHSKNKLSFSILKEFHDTVIKGKAPKDSKSAKNLITTQVLKEDKWTLDVVKKRQEKLLSTLKQKWELNK